MVAKSKFVKDPLYGKGPVEQLKHVIADPNTDPDGKKILQDCLTKLRADFVKNKQSYPPPDKGSVEEQRAEYLERAAALPDQWQRHKVNFEAAAKAYRDGKLKAADWKKGKVAVFFGGKMKSKGWVGRLDTMIEKLQEKVDADHLNYALHLETPEQLEPAPQMLAKLLVSPNAMGHHEYYVGIGHVLYDGQYFPKKVVDDSGSTYMTVYSDDLYQAGVHDMDDPRWGEEVEIMTHTGSAVARLIHLNLRVEDPNTGLLIGAEENVPCLGITDSYSYEVDSECAPRVSGLWARNAIFHLCGPNNNGYLALATTRGGAVSLINA